MRKAVTIVPGTPVCMSRIAVDGHDITLAVSRIAVDLPAAGAFPKVAIELGQIDLAVIEMPEAELVIPAVTREALVALGWTPPPEEP
jgi:hypothetical protein